MKQHLALGLLAMLAAVVIGTAAAQQPTNSPSATMPAPGLLATRVMLRYDQLGDDPTGANRRVRALRQMVHATYGVGPGLVAFGETALAQQDIDSPGFADSSSTGLADSMLGVRYRFLRLDTGPINTLRMTAQAAVRLPTGDNAFSTDAVSPSVGVNLTMIRDRHGFNATSLFTLTTGDTPQRLHPGDSLADVIRVSAAHLYRVAPSSYAESSGSAWYTQLELIGYAETNGDTSLDIAPGVLFEARRWAAEASVLLPIAHDLERRPRREVGVALGIRVLF